MQEFPHALQRPLVIVGGLLDPGIASSYLRNRFRQVTGDNRVISVSLGECMSMDECREKIIAAVDQVCPPLAPNQTAEVDVIGFSLGGVATRYASLPTAHRRLTIARLFTISAPMRGALAAKRLPVLHPLQNDLRPGSEVVRQLSNSMLTYPVCSYIRLGDFIVGQENAALEGSSAWWVPDAPLTDPHGGAYLDARILADIARRLRDETPLARSPASALPVAAG